MYGPELLMRLHQETEVAVLTEVRGDEYFRCLAAHLPVKTKQKQDLLNNTAS